MQGTPVANITTVSDAYSIRCLQQTRLFYLLPLPSLLHPSALSDPSISHTPVHIKSSVKPQSPAMCRVCRLQVSNRDQPSCSQQEKNMELWRFTHTGIVFCIPWHRPLHHFTILTKGHSGDCRICNRDVKSERLLFSVSELSGSVLFYCWQIRVE